MLLTNTSETPGEVTFWIEELRSQFDETLAAIKDGELNKANSLTGIRFQKIPNDFSLKSSFLLL